VNELVKIGIWGAIIGIAFAILWRKGYVVQLRDYVRETRVELGKCTWPSWDELKGSTVVVMVAIVLLGGFTVGVDFVISLLVRLIT